MPIAKAGRDYLECLDCTPMIGQVGLGESGGVRLPHFLVHCPPA